MGCENISAEFKEKARACVSVEELVQLAQDEGVELSDEQLESLAGADGFDWQMHSGNHCGSRGNRHF